MIDMVARSELPNASRLVRLNLGRRYGGSKLYACVGMAFYSVCRNCKLLKLGRLELPTSLALGTGHCHRILTLPARLCIIFILKRRDHVTGALNQVVGVDGAGVGRDKARASINYISSTYPIDASWRQKWSCYRAFLSKLKCDFSELYKATAAHSVAEATRSTQGRPCLVERLQRCRRLL